MGSVGAGFNVSNLMSGVLDETSLKFIQFKLYDTGPSGTRLAPSSISKERLLFESNELIHKSSARPAADNPDAIFTSVLPMEVGGRRWEVHFSARKDDIIDRVNAVLPWIVLAGGLLSSALLFGMFYFLATSRSRAVALAHEITRDLRDSTEQLQALSRRLVDVQESDRRQFSRELHDRIGQNLTALSINLDILKSDLAGDGRQKLQSRLDDSAALLESTTGAI